jgi:hypothetical protein
MVGLGLVAPSAAPPTACAVPTADSGARAVYHRAQPSATNAAEPESAARATAADRTAAGATSTAARATPTATGAAPGTAGTKTITAQVTP